MTGTLGGIVMRMQGHDRLSRMQLAVCVYAILSFITVRAYEGSTSG